MSPFQSPWHRDVLRDVPLRWVSFFATRCLLLPFLFYFSVPFSNILFSSAIWGCIEKIKLTVYFHVSSVELIGGLLKDPIVSKHTKRIISQFSEATKETCPENYAHDLNHSKRCPGNQLAFKCLNFWVTVKQTWYEIH